MKRKLLFVLGSCALSSILIFYSCKKSEQTISNPQTSISQTSNQNSNPYAKQGTGEKILLSDETVHLFANDKDLKNINNITRDFTMRLLNQKTLPLDQIDWYKNQDQVLAAINMSNQEYSDLLSEFQESVSGLISRYEVPPVSCNFCNLTNEEKTLKYRDLLIKVDKDRNYLHMLVGKAGGSGNGGGGGSNTGSLGCGWEYYACGVLCLATGEVPPIFLLCLGLCSCSWCSPPPPFCSAA